MTAPVAEKAAQVAATKVAKKSAAKKPPSKLPSSEPGNPVKNPRKAAQQKFNATKKAAYERKRMWMPRIAPAKSTVRYRQILAAEVLIGLIILIINMKNDSTPKEFSDRVHQIAAFIAVFFVLCILTTGGPSMARLCSSLGGVIVLVLAVKDWSGYRPTAVNKGMWPFSMDKNGNPTSNMNGGQIPGNEPADTFGPGGVIKGYPVNPKDGSQITAPPLPSQPSAGDSGVNNIGGVAIPGITARYGTSVYGNGSGGMLV